MTWTAIMNAMDGLVKGGGSMVLTEYDWGNQRHMNAALAQLRRLQACKDAQKAVQDLGEKFIDRKLARRKVHR